MNLLFIVFKFFYRKIFNQFLLARIKNKYKNLIIEDWIVFRIENYNKLLIGEKVHIGSFSEIVVIDKSEFSEVRGALNIGNRVIIGSGANIRAAGGEIVIGDDALIAQNVTLIAANHLIDSELPYRDSKWDKNRTGIKLGSNVWIGANAIILPGVQVGNNSIIAAGAVVNQNVPSNEIWGGVPANFIKNI